MTTHQKTGGIGMMKEQSHPTSITSRVRLKTFRLGVDFFHWAVKFYRAKHHGEKDYEKLSFTFSKISEFVKSEDIGLLVIIFPTLTDFNSYEFLNDHMEIRDILESNSIRYIDLLEYYKDRDARNLRIKKDDKWHPNKLGNEIAINTTFKYLLENRDLLKNFVI